VASNIVVCVHLYSRGVELLHGADFQRGHGQIPAGAGARRASGVGEQRGPYVNCGGSWGRQARAGPRVADQPRFAPGIERVGTRHYPELAFVFAAPAMLIRADSNAKI
jgi:hypothetical protein